MERKRLKKIGKNKVLGGIDLMEVSESEGGLMRERPKKEILEVLKALLEKGDIVTVKTPADKKGEYKTIQAFRVEKK